MFKNMAKKNVNSTEVSVKSTSAKEVRQESMVILTKNFNEAAQNLKESLSFIEVLDQLANKIKQDDFLSLEQHKEEVELKNAELELKLKTAKENNTNALLELQRNYAKELDELKYKHSLEKEELNRNLEKIKRENQQNISAENSNALKTLCDLLKMKYISNEEYDKIISDLKSAHQFEVKDLKSKLAESDNVKLNEMVKLETEKNHQLALKDAEIISLNKENNSLKEQLSKMQTLLEKSVTTPVQVSNGK